MDFNSIVDKVFSGRYFLTIITGLVFAYCSFSGKIEKDVIATVVTMVFTLYFTRTDRTSGNGKSDVVVDKSNQNKSIG